MNKSQRLTAYPAFRTALRNCLVRFEKALKGFEALFKGRQDGAEFCV